MASGEILKRELEVTYKTLVAADDIGALFEKLRAKAEREIEIWQWFNEVKNTTKRIRRSEEQGKSEKTITWEKEIKTRQNKKTKGEATDSSETTYTLASQDEVQNAYEQLNPQGVVHKIRFKFSFNKYLKLLGKKVIIENIEQFRGAIQEIHIDILEEPTSERDGFQLVRFECEFSEDISIEEAKNIDTRASFVAFIDLLNRKDIMVNESKKGQKALAIEAAKETDGIIKTPADFSDWVSAEVEEAA